MDYSFRQARNEDAVWLEPFYESIMRPYVELNQIWDASKFKEYYDPKKISIIQVNGKDIGLLKIDYFENHIYLADIQLNSRYQGKGIGSRILNTLIKDSEYTQRPIRLKVLKGNRARELYERHGFKLKEELKHNVLLEYKL